MPENSASPLANLFDASLTSTEKTCAECGKAFQKDNRVPQQLFCSKKCQIKRWRNEHRSEISAKHSQWVAKNREANNAYQREWRSGGAPHIKTPPTKSCLQCAIPFQKRKGPAKFCSAKCRRKYTNDKPEEKAKRRVRTNAWTARNKERNRAYHNRFYHARSTQKHTLYPWRSLLTGAKKRAKDSAVVFNLTEEWARLRWKGCCELTGLPFCAPEKRVGYKNRNFNPSIDRIRAAEGYTTDNCRFVLWAVNSFKRDGSDEDMYRIARALIANLAPHAESILALPG